jgi:phage gp46-like protein
LVQDGYGTWYLELREEHRLRACENRVLVRIFRPKRDGVTRGYRGLQNEELHNLYSLLNIIRKMRVRARSMNGAEKYAHRILVGE